MDEVGRSGWSFGPAVQLVDVSGRDVLVCDQVVDVVVVPLGFRLEPTILKLAVAVSVGELLGQVLERVGVLKTEATASTVAGVTANDRLGVGEAGPAVSCCKGTLELVLNYVRSVLAYPRLVVSRASGLEGAELAP